MLRFPVEKKLTNNTMPLREPMLPEAYMDDVLSRSDFSQYRFVTTMARNPLKFETAIVVASCLGWEEPKTSLFIRAVENLGVIAIDLPPESGESELCHRYRHCDQTKASWRQPLLKHL